ncbi:MAG: hypothetical protein AAB380_00685 [Verrucomicrobiota bacterium]
MTAKELQDKIERHRKEIVRIPKEEAAGSVNFLIAAQQSEIFVAASQLAELSTRRIIRLTWFLAFLTLVLVGLTIGLLILTYVLTKHP